MVSPYFFSLRKLPSLEILLRTELNNRNKLWSDQFIPLSSSIHRNLINSKVIRLNGTQIWKALLCTGVPSSFFSLSSYNKTLFSESLPLWFMNFILEIYEKKSGKPLDWSGFDALCVSGTVNLSMAELRKSLISNKPWHS